MSANFRVRVYNSVERARMKTRVNMIPSELEKDPL